MMLFYVLPVGMLQCGAKPDRCAGKWPVMAARPGKKLDIAGTLPKNPPPESAEPCAMKPAMAELPQPEHQNGPKRI